MGSGTLAASDRNASPMRRTPPLARRGHGPPRILLVLLVLLALLATITSLQVWSRPAAARAGRAMERISFGAMGKVDPGPSSPEKDAARILYRAKHLFDGIKWTSWCGTRQGEKAIGHRIRVEFTSVRYPTLIEIINGDIHSPKAFKEGVQTRTLLLRYEGGERTFSLARNVVDAQSLRLSSPVGTRWLEIEVQQVHPGGAKRGPCFSDILIQEPKDLLSLKPEMRQEIQELVSGLKVTEAEELQGISTRLAEIGSPVNPWLLPLLREGTLPMQRKVVKLLPAVGGPQAGPALVESYEKSSDRALRKEVLQALLELKASSTVPFLLGLARGEDREMARLALLAMEGFGDPRTLQPFLKIVIYQEEELARIAIRHLIGFGSQAYRALLPYLGHPAMRIRERAVWAIGRINSPEARRALMRSLESGEARLVLAAMRGLGETGTDENFELLLLNADHEDGSVREAVADALGGFEGNEMAAEAAAKLARDGEPAVRRRALSSLMRLGQVAIRSLLALIRDASGEVLDEALDAATRLSQPQAGRVYVALLGDHREAVRDLALSLIEARGNEGLTELIHAMASEDPRVRFVSSRHLEELGEAALPAMVQQATASDDPAIRMMCFKAIARIGSPIVRRTVLKGLSDPSPEVQREALKAAGKIPWNGYFSKIPKILEDADRQTHLLAVEVAGGSRIEEALPVLVRQIEADHPNSIRIIWALGRLGDMRALPCLAKKARSQEAFTRQQVMAALGSLRSEESLGLLMEAMLDGDPMVRKAAEQALAGR